MVSALMPLQATSTHPLPCTAPSLPPSILTTHGFNLFPHRPSLREKSRGIAVSTVNPYLRNTRRASPGASTRADTLSRRPTSPMPPFNLLVNAPVLTNVEVTYQRSLPTRVVASVGSSSCRALVQCQCRTSWRAPEYDMSASSCTSLGPRK